MPKILSESFDFFEKSRISIEKYSTKKFSTLQQAKALPNRSEYRNEIGSGKPKLSIEKCQKSSNFGLDFSEDFVKIYTGGFNQVGGMLPSQFWDGESEFEVG